MKATRPLILVAAVLTLLVSACSQPKDFAAPTLEPQFGTADDDIGIDIATISTGRIYSISEQSGTKYEYDREGNPYKDGTYTSVLLKRQDSSGNITWSKEVTSATCRDFYDYYDCESVEPISIFADAQGNVSVLTSYTYEFDDYYDDYSGYAYAGYTIRKYDASGNYLSVVEFSNDSSSPNPLSFTVDGTGSVYVARRDWNTSANIVAKHSTSGGLVWQRTSTVGTPYGITVSSSGSVYVVGTTGVARYTSSGNLTWSKAANNSKGVLANSGNIVVSGSYIYTRSGKDIRKYDGNGKQLWLKTQSGLNTIVVQDVDGDGSGNLYLSGKYLPSSTSKMSAFVRKLSASGSILWTKTYGTPAYDDARGIATITGSEIYTTGETQGSLAHPNRGGRDGYLRKQSSSGGLVWTR